MSDFLSQFSDDKYSKNKPEAAENTAPPAEIAEDSAGPANVITGPQHDTVIDTYYHKRKLTKGIIIAAAGAALIFLVIFAIFMMNRVEVKNFVDTSISDAKTWGMSNKITIETNTVFNKEHAENMIISQSKEAGKKISKGAVLSFEVSKGADPDEKIALPDFATMSASEINRWIDDNKVVNANVITEFSESVPLGQLIRTEFNDPMVTAADYARRNGLLIYLSKGTEKLQKNITMLKFDGKPKSDVEVFAQTNDIDVTYEEAASDTVVAGCVISQDVQAGTKVAKKSKLKVVISQGKAVTVPNFANMTKEEATAVTALNVTIKSKYSNSVPYGQLISQSEPSGKKLVAPAEISVVYSEGQPYISSLKGQSENTLPALFYDYKNGGANITYSVYYVDSSDPKGQVTDSSKFNEYLSMNDHVDVYISRGNLEPETPPDLPPDAAGPDLGGDSLTGVSDDSTQISTK